MRAGRRTVERDEQPVLDLLGELVLEALGQPVGFVPGVAEQVGQEALDDPVTPDGVDRGPATRRRERHTPIGRVVDQIPVGEALHRCGDGAGAHPEPFRERAGVGLPVLLGEPVDGFQGLALRFGELLVCGFDG